MSDTSDIVVRGISQELVRRVKATAASEGMTVKNWVTVVLENRLRDGENHGVKIQSLPVEAEAGVDQPPPPEAFAWKELQAREGVDPQPRLRSRPLPKAHREHQVSTCVHGYRACVMCNFNTKK